MYLLNLLTQVVTSQLLLNQQFIFCTFLQITSELKEIVYYSKRPISLLFHALLHEAIKKLTANALKLSQDNTPNCQVILMKLLVKFSQFLHFLLTSICTACFKLLEKVWNVLLTTCNKLAGWDC